MSLLLQILGALLLGGICLLIGMALAKLEARERRPGQMSADWLRRHLPGPPWRRRA